MDGQGDALRLLGRRIRELRLERKMTLDMLAARSGLDAGELDAAESGEVDIPITSMIRLARAFGVTLDEFLNFLP